ncbi:hypothetical protein [Tepidibacillus fermentans]|uniref:Uncharacterized protein n=1 Tax=Tepidibacillus fermentans TaxID=1281767 RepID=A0A4R3KKN6_9BACI|nr:hypothetical protein [Tepidibacillus fermentans]TCS83811.1 hypothetical protein EDD72_103137 [Tepidibacillus fermentans]
MGRLAQGMITGGIVAAVIGIVMRRSRHNQKMLNRYMNMLINMMAKNGMFRLIGNSRFFRNMVRAR